MFFRPLFFIGFSLVLVLFFSCDSPSSSLYEEINTVKKTDGFFISEAHKFFEKKSTNGRENIKFSKVDIPFNVDWSQSEVLRFGSENMVISPITFPIQVKGKVNQFEQKLLITLDKEGKILSSVIFQISTEDKTFLIDNKDAFFKNVYSNTIDLFLK